MQMLWAELILTNASLTTIVFLAVNNLFRQPDMVTKKKSETNLEQADSSRT